MATAITGWDFGTGRPVPLPVDPPQEILLVRAHPDAIDPTTQKAATLRIWGLHPMLVVVVTFYKRIRLDMNPDVGRAPYMDSQLQGRIQAIPIVKSMHPQRPVVEGPELPADEIFLNGGQLYDGCEINSGMQGIEFVITASLLGPSDYEEVATVQIKQKDPLGCIDLAEKLISEVKLEVGEPLSWP